MVSYLTSLTLWTWDSRLNPYCSGQWSRTYELAQCDGNHQSVLILVVVEDGLVLAHWWYCYLWCKVLILIVVEDGLVQLCQQFQLVKMGLNPYCSGRWPRTGHVLIAGNFASVVLILIVVEDGLVPVGGNATGLKFKCLNPYCSGRWSRTHFRTHYLYGLRSLNPYCSGRWSRTLLSFNQ